MNKPDSIETLRWKNSVFEMIDQRILPFKFEYLSYDSAAGVAEGIKTMVVRGAPAIGCAAAFGVALEAIRLQKYNKAIFDAGLNTGFDILAASRPTAVNLFWALNRMRKLWDDRCDLPNSELAE
ncbi:MAG: hypothetical protein ABI480_13300, partial [Chitinophagaceae bacterium]